MNKFKKQYQLWSFGDYSYSPAEFDSIEELLDELAGKWTTNFYITQKVDLSEIPALNKGLSQ